MSMGSVEWSNSTYKFKDNPSFFLPINGNVKEDTVPVYYPRLLA